MTQSPLSKETLEERLDDATRSLLEIARDNAWNNIADNCLFILSENINQFDNKGRKAANDKKVPKPLSELMPVLLKLYDDVYEFDLYIYKSSKEQTVIEIEYAIKWPDTPANTTPYLHAKISIPSYAAEFDVFKTKRKFDVNW